MYLCIVKIIKNIINMNELKDIELKIEQIKSAINNWQRMAKILEIDEIQVEEKTNELLGKLSKLLKKLDELKKK